MNKIISPIAIDMGAKNTGVYLQHFEQGEDPTTSGNSAGRTIVIDGDSITWSQVNRTQKRHQVRGNKRRKLAKRLLLVILGKSYGISPISMAIGEIILFMFFLPSYFYSSVKISDQISLQILCIETHTLA